MKAPLFVAVALAFAACSKTEPSQPTPESTRSSPPAPGANAATKGKAKDPEAARNLIAAGAVVIDVRTSGEYAEAHVPTATNIPVQELSARMAEIDKLVGGDMARAIIVYCASGHRAGVAKAQLDRAGHTTVVNGGGLDDLL